MKHNDELKAMQDWYDKHPAAIPGSYRPEYDHDAECEEALHAELRKLRGLCNTLHRQRNALLQDMRCILASAQNWNGGWVGRGEDARDVIKYIAETAGNAIAEVARNGQ